MELKSGFTFLISIHSLSVSLTPKMAEMCTSYAINSFGDVLGSDSLRLQLFKSLDNASRSLNDFQKLNFSPFFLSLCTLCTRDLQWMYSTIMQLQAESLKCVYSGPRVSSALCHLKTFFPYYLCPSFSVLAYKCMRVYQKCLFSYITSCLVISFYPVSLLMFC